MFSGRMSDPNNTDAPLRLQPLFDSATAEAVPQLFATYGIELVSVDQNVRPPISFVTAGVLGFTGPAVRGSLVIALTTGLAEQTNPMGASGNPRDWVGELANQLLGRIKLALLDHGLDIYLNLPAVLKGEHLAPIPRREVQPMAFQATEGMVGVWIEIEEREGASAERASGDRAKLGEAIFFE
jgi:CheY-specific phosphatase CheX